MYLSSNELFPTLVSPIMATWNWFLKFMLIVVIVSEYAGALYYLIIDVFADYVKAKGSP